MWKTVTYYKSIQYCRSFPKFKPDFFNWAQKRFGTIERRELSLIYRTLVMNSYNCPMPLSRDFLRIFGYQKSKDIVSKIAKAINGTVFDFTIKEDCRTIYLPKDQAQQLLKEIEPFISSTGIPLDQTKERNKDVRSYLADKNFKKHKDHPCAEYLHYLNTIKYPQDLINNLEKRAQQLMQFEPTDKILQRIDRLDRASHGLPCAIYKLKGYRVYDEHLQSMHTDDRRYCMPRRLGYYEVDLAHCHLAIIAKLANLKTIQKLLKDGNDPRAIIASETNINPKKMKLLLNATLYGAGKTMRIAILDGKDKELKDARKSGKNIKSIELSDQAKSEYKKVIKHPLYKEIKAGVKKLMDHIKEKGCMFDAFDLPVLLTNCENRSTRVLSYVCQSYEKKLLMPIAKILKKQGGRIVLDHHDGLTIYCNPDRSDEILKRCFDKVDKVADELGIITRLTIKN